MKARIASRRYVLATLLSIILPVVAVLLFLVLPASRQHRISHNERHAREALKSLASANADFRANDRDGNGVIDFWTGDVAGLHNFGLIPREIAEADAAPLERLVPESRPYRGYLFVAMETDDSEDPAVHYKTATDASGRPVHHASKFGFCAFPADVGRSGRASLIINEGNTMFRFDDGRRASGWPYDELPLGKG